MALPSLRAHQSAFQHWPNTDYEISALMADGASDTIDFNRSPVPEVAHKHHPAELLRSNGNPLAQSHRALLVLNSPIVSIGLLDVVWQSCGFKICADGGANRLWDVFRDDDETRLKYLPDRIHGDLDSLQPHVNDYYAYKPHTMISKDEDKYSTDFGKCLNVIRTTLHADPMVEVLVLGSIGGRVDQGIGLLGEMMRELKNDKKAAEGQRTKFWLVSEASLTFVLMPGKNVVAFPRGCVEGRSSQTGGDEIKRSGSHEPLFTPNVGILPLFGKAHISTRGLEWDVADWRTEMGGQISTSNHIMADEVTVWTEKEVLFTVELNGAHFET